MLTSGTMTPNQCPLYHGSCGSHALLTIVWLLISSGLLFATWNHVIKPLFGVKVAKFWQVLLLVGTVLVLSMPHMLHLGKGHKCSSGAAHEPCPMHDRATPAQ